MDNGTKKCRRDEIQYESCKVERVPCTHVVTNLISRFVMRFHIWCQLGSMVGLSTICDQPSNLVVFHNNLFSLVWVFFLFSSHHWVFDWFRFDTNCFHPLLWWVLLCVKGRLYLIENDLDTTCQSLSSFIASSLYVSFLVAYVILHHVFSTSPVCNLFHYVS